MMADKSSRQRKPPLVILPRTAGFSPIRRYGTRCWMSSLPFWRWSASASDGGTNCRPEVERGSEEISGASGSLCDPFDWFKDQGGYEIETRIRASFTAWDLAVFAGHLHCHIKRRAEDKAGPCKILRRHLICSCWMNRRTIWISRPSPGWRIICAAIPVHCWSFPRPLFPGSSCNDYR